MENDALIQHNPGESFAAPIPEAKPAAKSSRKVFAYQLLAFFLTALLYSLTHALRTVWGYIKPNIKDKDPYFSTETLGTLDFSFMIAYATGQYINGYLGDRVNLKVFLTLGMAIASLGLGLFSYLEGMITNPVHNPVLDIFAFVLNGLGQSTAYPACVSIVGNWFSAAKSGTVFGLWGTNLNFGDILGQQIGRIAVDQEHWNWPFAIFLTIAVLAFFLASLLIFVKVHPKDIAPDQSESALSERLIQPEISGTRPAGHGHGGGHGHGHGGGQGISFIDALKIKNVASYGFAFFCVKGVIYGVIFWLPLYLKKEVGFEEDISLLLASIEIGQLVGSVLLGYLSDRIKSRSIMIAFGFFFSVIFLVFTFMIKEIRIKSLYFVLLFLAGVGVGGPASMIGGAVSTDIGQKLAKKGINAVSTIAGIMEGCGASGAAITSKVVSYFTTITFPIFAGLCLVGGLVMVPVAIRDFQKIKRRQLNPDAPMDSDSEAEEVINNQNF